MNPYILNLILGLCLGTIFIVIGLASGPLLTYWLHPNKRYMDPKTRREVLNGVPSVTHFFGILIPALVMTIGTFLAQPSSAGFAPDVNPATIGSLMFVARYGSVLMIGTMVLSWFLLKYVRPLRRVLYRRAPQAAADLYAN